jgi:hypothetical protein
MAKRLHLFLFIAEQQRADHFGCYGNPILKTPARSGSRRLRAVRVHHQGGPGLSELIDCAALLKDRHYAAGVRANWRAPAISSNGRSNGIAIRTSVIALEPAGTLARCTRRLRASSESQVESLQGYTNAQIKRAPSVAAPYANT